eukprot:4034202-Karenia_brevis.AAC.1
MRVTWAQIEPGLPPADRCGSIQALDFCEPTVQSYLRQPLNALVDLETVDSAPKPGMMMGSKKREHPDCERVAAETACEDLGAG